MYRVTIYNGSTATIIHEPSVDPADPHLYTCSLVQGSSGEIDTLSFDILPNNPGYDLLASRTTMATVYNTATGKNEFSGRVLTITPQMDSSGLIYKSVTCEDRLGFLCDSIQPYTPEATYPLEDFFKLLLENHNSQVEDYKKIYPGLISATASASTGNVTKGLNYESTWEALKTKLLDTEGGEIQLYEGADGLLYLDYVDELGRISDATIELGKNMASISQEIDPTDVITRLIPLGANLEADDDDVDTDAKTTIESVNNGSLWIDDEEAQAVYGIVVGTVEWEDVTEPSNLLTKANAWMAAQTVTDKVTLTALDLSIIGLEADAIERYNYYRVINAAIGLDAYLRAIKSTTNICSPSDKTFEMGERNSSLSSTLTGANKTAGAAAADAVAAINGQLSKTVTALIASNATIIQLQSTLAEIETAYIKTADIETLLADYARIEDLDATNAAITNLSSVYATIENLDAATANVTDLAAEVANINSLLAGNIGAGTVQTIHLSADNTVIDEALIDTIYAANGIISDLVAGTIYTDNVQIANNAGQNLWIDGATIQINDGTNVRVQIGEDASGGYNLYLWNANGVLIWDALGLTEAGLTGNGAIIKDAAVADDAAIKGTKLDISSVASCLNEDGSLVVDAANVTINDSTLAAEYVTIKTATTEAQATADEALELAAAVETRTTTLETSMEVVQGQITAKVWQTDITEAISGISIGSRNYLPNTRTMDDWYTASNVTLAEDDEGYTVATWAATSVAAHNSIYNTPILFSLVRGQTVTLSFDVRSDDYANINTASGNEIIISFRPCPANSTSSTLYRDISLRGTAIYNEWMRLTYTATLTDDFFTTGSGDIDDTTRIRICIFNCSVYTMQVRKVKLEIGTVPTDWTPAPEDTEAAITTIQDQYATVTQTIEGITTEIGDISTVVGNNYTELNSKIATVEETAEGISAKVSDLTTTVNGDGETVGLVSRMTTLETTAEGLTSRVSATETTLSGVGSVTEYVASEINQFADSISLSVSDGTLGSTASIKLSVNGADTIGEVDLTEVRKAFANDTSAVTISAGTVTFEAGTLLINAGNFTMDEDGNIVATNGTFSGKVTATSGTIGGFTIGSSALYNSKSSLSSTASGVYVGTDGISLGSTFSVTKAGAITAKSGTIGPLTIANSSNTDANSGHTYGSSLFVQQYGTSVTVWDATTDNSTVSTTVDAEFGIKATGSSLTALNQYLIWKKSGDAWTNEIVPYYVNGWGKVKCSGIDIYPTRAIYADGDGDLTYCDSELCCIYTGTYYAYLNLCKIVNDIDPASTNTYDFGSSSYYYRRIYVDSVYRKNEESLSDRKLKQNVKPLTENYEQLIMGLNAVEYDFIDGDSHRKHMGFIAQDVRDTALATVGDLSLFSASVIGDDHAEYSEELSDEQLQWYLSYEELIAPLVAMVQHQQRRIEQLETALAAITKEE